VTPSLAGSSDEASFILAEIASAEEALRRLLIEKEPEGGQRSTATVRFFEAWKGSGRMRLTFIRMLGFAWMIAVAAPSVAQGLRGDVAAGKRLAANWCGACHVVEPRRTQPGDAASSFQSIASLPSTTALSLKVFLRTSHQDMPNFQLTLEESDDVIAYLLSLKRN
jgi:cytochrome c